MDPTLSNNLFDISHISDDGENWLESTDIDSIAELSDILCEENLSKKSPNNLFITFLDNVHDQFHILDPEKIDPDDKTKAIGAEDKNWGLLTVIKGKDGKINLLHNKLNDEEVKDKVFIAPNGKSFKLDGDRFIFKKMDSAEAALIALIFSKALQDQDALLKKNAANHKAILEGNERSSILKLSSNENLLRREDQALVIEKADKIAKKTELPFSLELQKQDEEHFENERSLKFSEEKKENFKKGIETKKDKVQSEQGRQKLEDQESQIKVEKGIGPTKR